MNYALKFTYFKLFIIRQKNVTATLSIPKRLHDLAGGHKENRITRAKKIHDSS